MQSQLKDKQIRPLSSAAELVLTDKRFFKAYTQLKALIQPNTSPEPILKVG